MHLNVIFAEIRTVIMQIRMCALCIAVPFNLQVPVIEIGPRYIESNREFPASTKWAAGYNPGLRDAARWALGCSASRRSCLLIFSAQVASGQHDMI